MKDGLSQRGARNRTNGAPTGKPLKTKQRARATSWQKLQRACAADIRRGIVTDRDARATDAEFWQDAKVVWPRGKTLVTMRIDSDLLEWFRRERGYQAQINAILRAYVKAQTSNPRQPTRSKV